MNLNIKAPLNGFLGYGHASINIIKALNKKGSGNISVFPIGGINLTTDDSTLFQQLLNSRYDSFSPNNPSLTIFHEFSFFDALQSKKEVIGFPFFELDEMEPVRKKSLSCLDRVFVASQWAKEVIEGANLNLPIDVVPLGVDNSIFYPKDNKGGPYKFFTVGKIERRKCSELLPRIFAAAFSPEDDVELHIMCDSPLPQIRQQMPEFKEMCKVSPLGSKIHVHSVLNTDMDLANFMRGMDCGIYMTRAEGWGLPILQTLACGKPVITTDYSAHTEFCNNDNCRLVNITEKEIAFDGLWFDGSCGAWASIKEPQIQQCISHMQELYKDGVRNNPQGIETAKKFTWDNTANVITGTISN